MCLHSRTETASVTVEHLLSRDKQKHSSGLDLARDTRASKWLSKNFLSPNPISVQSVSKLGSWNRRAREYNVMKKGNELLGTTIQCASPTDFSVSTQPSFLFTNTQTSGHLRSQKFHPCPKSCLTSSSPFGGNILKFEIIRS